MLKDNARLTLRFNSDRLSDIPNRDCVARRKAANALISCMAETAATRRFLWAVRSADPVTLPSLLFRERANGQVLPRFKSPPMDIVH
jgi:hypothetical protein